LASVKPNWHRWSQIDISDAVWCHLKPFDAIWCKLVSLMPNWHQWCIVIKFNCSWTLQFIIRVRHNNKTTKNTENIYDKLNK
jgi:hypothetical protein